jgi:hypothetical protein
VFQLSSIPYAWWEAPREATGFPLRFYLTSRSGTSYSGQCLYRSGSTVPCSAALSGERDIRVVIPTLGVEFRGHVAYPTQGVIAQLIVTQIGGAENGRTWTLDRTYY